ncbi:MAG: cob(I)yrinic acid a,c-diamide adenosyltransferase [Thermaerobacter sp.]|nr:cob(I)yrinic acid a,c-diamide adenosyltransferase [Thermaerobacter sp.]
MPIYTRRGDAGKTQVIGSPRRYKDDARVQAYGTVDEAGALIGVAASMIGSDAAFEDVVRVLSDVQQMLWDVGADLARVGDEKHPYRTSHNAASQLEPMIDQYQAELPLLDKFILRGGTPGGALLHLACTVVRRAEREVVHLQRIEPIHPPLLMYLNRLSDLLFVLGRLINHRAGAPETEYEHSARVFR